MKRSDSILLNYYRGNLPKYQQRPGTVNNDAILAYMRGLPGGAPRPQLSQQQIAQLVSKTKPLTQLSATQIKQQQYNLKQKEQDAAEERSRQFIEEEERRLQAERAAARRTREAVIGGDENAMFTFPTGETKRWRDMNWREQQYVAGKNLGALNRGDWTDYINPLAMVGSLSEGLATAPYVAQQTDSYLPYVTGIGAPLLTGALAGVGAKNVGQFAENIISPIPARSSDVGQFLTERTPLKYTYKINPWAFKPQEGMMYRGIGQEGFEDALESGVFRSKQNVEPIYFPGTNFRASKEFSKAYFTPNFETASRYGQGYVAEVPLTASDWGRRYGRQTWSQIARRDIPVNEGRILQKDWLMGYKEAPTVYRDINSINASNLGKYLNLSDDVSRGEGAYNLGVYPFKRDPRFLFKVGTNTSNFSQVMPKITDDIVELTKDLNPSQYAKIFRSVDLSGVNTGMFNQSNKLRLLGKNPVITGTVMPRLEGKSLDKLGIPELAQMDALTLSRYLEEVNRLDQQGIAFDIFGNNALYRPEENTFSYFDLFPKKDVKSTMAYPYTRKVSETDEILEFDRGRVKNDMINKIRSQIIQKHNEMPGEYADDYIDQLLRRLEGLRKQVRKSGGPIVNPRGYIDGQPPKGSNWRIPGDGMGTSITMDLPDMPDEILVVPDGDFDQAKVMKRGEEEYFAGADFVDEYTMGPGGTTGPKIAVRDYPTMKGGGLTANKAREILHHGEVHGRPLTEKQRRYFGAMSKGHTKNYQLGGNALAMLRDYGGGISVPRLNSPVPKAQLGLPIKSTTPIISPILNLIDLFAGDKEDVAAKPKAPEVTLEEYFNIVDPRKIRATTGKPINPNVDLVAGQYPSSYIAQELKLAKQKGLSKEDAWNLAAIAFQESGWGKTDRNLGHVIGPAGKGNYGSSLINAYMNKMAEADRLGITDPYTRLQVYNGLGKIFPSTEQKYHGFKMKKIYGVPVPQGGLSLRDNPLYGKQVVDIRENVLKKNPEVVQYVESLYKKDGGLLPKAQVGEEITYTHQPSRIRDGFVDLGPGELYMLKRTVTPYTKNRDIRRYTQAPTDPRQVNFISNYAGAIGEPLSKSYGEYPTAVPFEGEKHWNIDRFIIDPAFNNYPNFKTDQTKKQLTNNVLADMHKYFMLQGEDRDDAFKSAKKFVRQEVKPRVNSEFFESVFDKTMPLGHTLDTFADSNPIDRIRSLNRAIDPESDQYVGDNPYYAQYKKNPMSEKKMEKLSLSYLKNFRKMSSKDARQMIKGWKQEADEKDREYERSKANPEPIKYVTCPPGYEYNVEVQDCLPIQKQLQMGGGFGVFGYVGDGWYKNGGQHGGLDRWFAEKWVDIKSGKPCGRQEGESRAYPACRPSKRVSSKTPKTSGEMSSSEKAKFKSSKTSSQRIPYNHKRR